MASDSSEENLVLSVSDSPYEIDHVDRELGEGGETLAVPHAAIQPYMFEPIASDADDEESDSDHDGDPEPGIPRDIQRLNNTEWWVTFDIIKHEI